MSTSTLLKLENNTLYDGDILMSPSIKHTNYMIDSAII